MIKITKNKILHLAKLSNLNLTDSEIEKFQKELESILTNINQISEIQNLESNSFNLTSLTNVYSKDEINNFDILDIKDVVKNSETYNDYFVVDALIDRNKN